MTRLLKKLVILLLGITAFSAHADKPVEPYPLDYFALRDVISNVELSPDGKKLALLRIPSKEGNPILEVYDTANMKKKPFRMDAKPMELTAFEWIGDNDIVFYARQKVRDKIEGFNQGVYETSLARLQLKKKKIKKFRIEGANIVNVLPKEKNKVIISVFDKSVGRINDLRAYSYYELDLISGVKKLISRARLNLFNIDFDGEGNQRTAIGFDVKDNAFKYFYRAPDQKEWQEIYSLSENSHESFEIVGLDDAKQDGLFVVAHNGRDKKGLWEFDTRKKQFGELIYARNDVDVIGVRGHSNKWSYPDKVVGVTYATDKPHVEYFDGTEKALYDQLEKVIPYAYFVRITSRSRDGNTLVIYNVGPRDPGTYYLLKDGRLTTIGSKQPLLESEKLADVKYIQYKARDGKTISAYVTIPHGEKPFPLVVMPHGGPFVQEVVMYDEWAQMLANNGYMVVQPQYRGSEGYGLEFYLSAFINGGQGGKKMQDDKDDAALYLVKEGWADPDRLAMYGWSYGGYAALIAASRKPNIYQCSIAGAAVSDMVMQYNYYRHQLRGASKVQQDMYRRGSINPIDVADQVNIPLLIIHGSVDQRVPVDHAKKYMNKLDELKIPYKYVELEGADHFSNTLFYNHQKKLYESIIDFLKNDCGPGGL